MRPHEIVARDRPKRLTQTISSVSLSWRPGCGNEAVTSLAWLPGGVTRPHPRRGSSGQELVFANRAGTRTAVLGRSHVNICQRLSGSLARNRSPSIQPGIHEMSRSSGQCRACFAQRFTHDRHAVGVRDATGVRSQVRAAGTHSGAGAGRVRRGSLHIGSHPPRREPGQVLLHQTRDSESIRYS